MLTTKPNHFLLIGSGNLNISYVFFKKNSKNSILDKNIYKKFKPQNRLVTTAQFNSLTTLHKLKNLGYNFISLNFLKNY
jgi:hypothetical protein